MNDRLLVIRKGAYVCVTSAGKWVGNEQFFQNSFFLFSHSPLKYLQNDIWFGIGQKITEQMMSLKTTESAELILRNIEFRFSEDSKAKSPSNVAYFPPILFFKTITI